VPNLMAWQQIADVFGEILVDADFQGVCATARRATFRAS
jgi:hypothetical protein